MLESKVAQHHLSFINLFDFAYRLGLVGSEENYHLHQLLQMINDHFNQEMWDSYGDWIEQDDCYAMHSHYEDW